MRPRTPRKATSFDVLLLRTLDDVEEEEEEEELEL